MIREEDLRKMCVAGWGEHLTQRGSKPSRSNHREICSQVLGNIGRDNFHQCYFDPLEIQALALDQFGDV